MKSKVIKHKTKWIQGSLNKKYWGEVLMGRTIVSLCWDKEKMTGFILDNGEWVGITTSMGRDKHLCGTISIQISE